MSWISDAFCRPCRSGTLVSSIAKHGWLHFGKHVVAPAVRAADAALARRGTSVGLELRKFASAGIGYVFASLATDWTATWGGTGQALLGSATLAAGTGLLVLDGPRRQLLGMLIRTYVDERYGVPLDPAAADAVLKKHARTVASWLAGAPTDVSGFLADACGAILPITSRGTRTSERVCAVCGSFAVDRRAGAGASPPRPRKDSPPPRHPPPAEVRSYPLLFVPRGTGSRDENWESPTVVNRGFAVQSVSVNRRARASRAIRAVA
jgi:hypothetical protein